MSVHCGGGRLSDRDLIHIQFFIFVKFNLATDNASRAQLSVTSRITLRSSGIAVS